MTITTKVVAWVGAIFGSVAIIAVVLIICVMLYAGHRNAEWQRHTGETLKQETGQDLGKLREVSKDYMKQMDLNEVFASPSPK